MQEMLDKVFFCPNPINSSIALSLFFFFVKPNLASFLRHHCSQHVRIPLWSPETHTAQKKSKALHKTKEKVKTEKSTHYYTRMDMHPRSRPPK
jgi:hypothetical protein